MKILIVEDDFVGRTLMQNILSKYGSCHAAANGKEGVTEFKKALEENAPYDLICLDIMMPVMDGQQALQEIRKFEQENSIGGSDCVKVIMTTALDDAKNIMSALVKGSADGYLNKPIEPEQLAQELTKLGFETPVDV